MSENDELERLRKENQMLKAVLDKRGVAICPICKSPMSQSTMKGNHSLYCLQVYGLCGEWMLSTTKYPRHKRPHTAFHRTTIRGGKVEPFKRSSDKFHYYLIRDKMVSREEYLKAAGILDEES